MIGSTTARAVDAAIRSLIAVIQISDASGKLLATLPYPELKTKAVASGEAAKYRISTADGSLVHSGKVVKKGEPIDPKAVAVLTMDRTDIQYGGDVSIDGIDIEVL